MQSIHSSIMYFMNVGDCPPLSDPQNGMVMEMGRSFGSKAMYSCDLGYMLDGAMTRTCQINGTWSGEEPRCKGKHWLYGTIQHHCMPIIMTQLFTHCNVHVLLM